MTTKKNTKPKHSTDDHERTYLLAVAFEGATLDRWPLQPMHMQSAGHRAALTAFRSVWERDQKVQLLSVEDELARTGGIGRVGGGEWLTTLFYDAFTASGAQYAQRRIIEAYRRADRRARLAAAMAACDEERDEDYAEIVAALDDPFFDDSRSYTATELGEIAYAKFSDPRRTMVPVGIEPIDKVIGGVSPGDVVFIGGSTGIGKSSLAFLALHANARAKWHVGVVQCEDQKETVGGRVLAESSGVSARKMRARQCDADDWQRAAAGLGLLAEHGARIHVRFVKGGTDKEVASAMTRLVREDGCQALVVDYVQAIRCTVRAESRKDQVREIASALGARALRLGVPLTMLSQLVRPLRATKFYEPSMHDMKEAGDLENMADGVILIWRAKDGLWAKLDKSKWGGEGLRFPLERDSKSGVLRIRPKWEEVDYGGAELPKPAGYKVGKMKPVDQTVMGEQ